MCVVLVIVNLSFLVILGRRVVELVSQQQTDEQKEQIEEEGQDKSNYDMLTTMYVGKLALA